MFDLGILGYVRISVTALATRLLVFDEHVWYLYFMSKPLVSHQVKSFTNNQAPLERMGPIRLLTIGTGDCSSSDPCPCRH